VVGALDDVQVVFDDQDGVALVHEPLKRPEKDRDILGVEPDGRLVKEVEDPLFPFMDEVIGELDALEFAAGKGGRGLPQPQVPETDLRQRRELLLDIGPAGKELERFFFTEKSPPPTIKIVYTNN
jgi:hypothetical protein